jgi:hypothetical protein
MALTIRNFNNRFRFLLLSILGVGLLALPLILLLLPADHFDKGKSVCLSVVLLKMECYGCGMTRAMMHLIHFEFTEAFYYNSLSFIVFPFLAYGYLQTLLKTYKGLRFLKESF